MNRISTPDTLHVGLTSWAQRYPDRVSLTCEDESVTYEELLGRSLRVAGALDELGVGPHDRVAYLGRDSIAFYEILYACAHVGAVLVPVNWRLAAVEVDFVVKDSGARVLFTDQPTADHAATVLHSIDTSGAPFAQWRDAQRPFLPAGAVWTRDDPVVQIYTSGTTGHPKGVVLAHRTFFAVRELLDAAGLDWIDWKHNDINLIALPSFHIGGLWWATQGLNAGVVNVIIPSFSAAAALAAIRSRHISTTCLVPAMMHMIISEVSCSKTDFRSLRKVVYGGSPIGRALLTRAQTILDCHFAQIYGLTETGNTALCLPPAEHGVSMTRIEAAGRPYPGIEIAIVDSDGLPTPEGDIGEILVSSPARMIEYFDRPDATADTLVDGWIRTGDAGYIDSEGFLFIRDRVKDIVIVAGENVYPAEIERALTEHDHVRDAAVIGIPDDRWGESVLAFVQREPKSRLSIREVANHLTGRIAPYKMPARYEFIESIPRNASGKILRRSLRERYWTENERQVN